MSKKTDLKKAASSHRITAIDTICQPFHINTTHKDDNHYSTYVDSGSCNRGKGVVLSTRINVGNNDVDDATKSIGHMLEDRFVDEDFCWDSWTFSGNEMDPPRKHSSIYIHVRFQDHLISQGCPTCGHAMS